jgi:hypothetical protein
MEDAGDLLRIRLKKKHLLKLKVRKTVGKAYTDQEKTSMLEQARIARSPHIYPALMLALTVCVWPSTRLTRRGVRFYRLSEVCLATHAAGVRSATC